ncbi:glutamine amidotransferase class-II (plasmid) [Azospirillum sp. B510]|uniref:class II glutamine amidotransferase n=1 Tax=Azospirillum sp. (strain B510) TaxID=137722 RepID=UPI0001C4BC3D|nr:glutamine amidotransferase family protein [Azospirillum sp. B510]BAI74482.1 glutamine amidotransferase class-II [Azospirillum sp. B510]
MCGIVGLFIKNPKIESDLGHMLSSMLEVMTGRGPDSAGFSIYGHGDDSSVKVSIRGNEDTDFAAIASSLASDAGQTIPLTIRSSHAILAVPVAREAAVRAALAAKHPDIAVVGSGQRMEIYKEVGLPADVARRFGLAGMAGTHAIGHTRMATESAVTTAGAHPFSTGVDQCLVHNGSLSNHNVLRRTLARDGIRFTTDNDSEVAAGYLTWRMRQGETLKEALTSSLDALDGFYTFVVGTESGFAVLRDPIACKPAVMAETDDYVAFGSEYRALADLPGIAKAKVWEPKPATVYSWERPA